MPSPWPGWWSATNLGPDAAVLDVGCAKGYMLVELAKLGITNVRGCDVSRYAVRHAHAQVRDRISIMSADALGFPDGAFDLVYAIDVVHNLPPEGCDQAIREIFRVSRGSTYIQVASFETPAQETALRDWGVTVRTFRDKASWREVFARVGYRGDYGFKTF